MVTYSIEALSTILSNVPAINGHSTFKALWGVVRVLLPILCRIKHPNHAVEGMAGMMMEAADYVLVYAKPWLVPEGVWGSLYSLTLVCP